MRIVIDAGHGGKDPGAVGNGLREKDLTLTLAKRIGQLLAARGVEVLYTRDTDVFVELSDRAKFANQAQADYFISLHINAGGGSGFESYVYTGSSGAKVAYQNVIHQHVALPFMQRGFLDRGTKQANLAVLRETYMPAILLEYGFIDHPKDAAMLADPAWLEALAHVTTTGVASAFGLPEVPEESVEDQATKAIDTMQLEQWQWKMLGDSLDGFYRTGLLGDYTWAEKAYKGLLTQVELTWINSILIARQNGAGQ